MEINKPHSAAVFVCLEKHGNYLFRFVLSRVRDRETAEGQAWDTLPTALKTRG
jgi:hypothetical protein